MAAGRSFRLPIWEILSRCMLCTAGLVLSGYAFYVETSKEADHSYTAMCDVSESVSCSKVFTSRFGRGFGLVEPILGADSPLNLPNSIFGLAFYIMQLCLGVVPGMSVSIVLLATSVLSCLGCVYLAYILYFILQDACIVCISTYVVNTFMLIVNIKRVLLQRKAILKKQQ
ncbi:vitamin K epoxide reductase complex subunit 1-like protein 1 [Branchiostoma floridae]|uniref:vitamin-K-epoxide reductase (warfarin-sensitive) n=1 Tax=Branchiostoma floridae TaxID=7739 RepID=A0A9J7N6B2_BRAFL|nr:vitamin K epoxide reductase complex subunit 1-like protein 1 [Branchiostoma floridae]